jgi:DNA-binding IclR family transcriptional regulator
VKRAFEQRSAALGIGSIARTVLVLRTLSTFGSKGAALKTISAACALPKPSVHRMLAALLAARLIERVDNTREYRLGPELFAFGASIAEVADLRGLAKPSLQRLAGEAGGVAYLGIRSGFDALCIDRVDGNEAPSDLPLDVMDRWPLGVGVFSLVLLAFMPASEIREVIEYNRRRQGSSGYFDGDALLSSLAEVRASGFALRSLGAHRKLSGIAVPILDDKQRPVASLSLVGLPSCFGGQPLKRIVGLLQAEAGEIRNLYDTRRRARDGSETWRQWLDSER